MILGLDRLLARVRGREDPVERADDAPAAAGAAAPDDELSERIDAARLRLREQIPPIEDPPG